MPLYSLFIFAYGLLARVATLFSEKARLWVGGREHWKSALASMENSSNAIWFHCASVGEFEQARPVIETLKAQNPARKILLTFFSPSGYELRQNYRYADRVTYLPTDTRANAKAFLDRAKPAAVVFVKYEFWFHFMTETHQRNIPFYLISAHFPKGHFLLGRPGRVLGKRLAQFTKIFVQDTDSVRHLAALGITQVEAVGDTRFDRVVANRHEEWDNDAVKQFTGNAQVLVIGSNWPADDKVILPVVMQKTNLKIIVAPHEMNPAQWSAWAKAFEGKTVRWTAMEQSDVSSKQVLFVDTVGVLSKLYGMATVAYVGGGFGRAVHNTLEAAVYGIPVIFGTENKRFLEVQQLKTLGIGTEISNANAFKTAVERALTDVAYRTDCAKKAEAYFAQNTGATQRIVAELNR